VHVMGPKGERTIAFGDFHLQPGDTPERETVLEPGDLVTAVTLPAPIAGAKQHYLKLRDRASYEFALASAAVVVSVDAARKVTGTAQYTSDFHFPGQLYAVPVEARIASGRITKLDTSAAEAVPNVRAVLHRGTIGPLFRAPKGAKLETMTDERRPPLEDDV